MFRNIVELRLVRATIPMLDLSWTLMHVIDEASPLAGMDGVTMEGLGLRFFLMIRAEDATLATAVRDLRTYDAGQVRFGMRYAGALSYNDGAPVLDLDRLGLIEPE